MLLLEIGFWQNFPTYRCLFFYLVMYSYKDIFKPTVHPNLLICESQMEMHASQVFPVAIKQSQSKPQMQLIVVPYEESTATNTRGFEN